MNGRYQAAGPQVGRKGLAEGEKDLVKKADKTFEISLDFCEDFVAENTCQCFFVSFPNNQSVLVQPVTKIGRLSFHGDLFKMMLNKYFCG